MLQLDQILRASELSISLMAALPALLLSWAALAGAVRWLTPRAPDVKRDAVPLRMAGADAARALQALLRQQQREQREQREQEQATAPASPEGIASLSEEGMVLYRLSCMYLETERLYRWGVAELYMAAAVASHCTVLLPCWEGAARPAATHQGQTHPVACLDVHLAVAQQGTQPQ